MRVLAAAILVMILAGAALFALLGGRDEPAGAAAPGAVAQEEARGAVVEGVRAPAEEELALAGGDQPPADGVAQPSQAPERPSAGQDVASPQGPAITGRLVAPDLSGPVAGAQIAVRRTQRSGSYGRHSAQSDDHGRFRISIGSAGTTESVGIDARAAGVGRRLLEVREPPPQGLDVGDVVLEAARDVHLLVRGAGGAPLRAALAYDDAEPAVQSAPSGPDGRLVLPLVLASSSAVLVRALDHRSQLVPLSPGAGAEDAPLEVALQPVPGLVVELRDELGAPATGVALEVLCFEPEPFLADSGRSAGATQLDLAGVHLSGQTSYVRPGAGEPHVVLTFEPPHAGRLQLAALAPSTPVELRVLDAGLRIVARRTLQPEELVPRPTVRLVVPGPARALAVRVVDEAGAPVESASLHLAGADSAAWRGAHERVGQLAATDGLGRARLAPLHLPSIDLELRRRGRLSAVCLGVPLPEAENELEVVLEAGATLRVRAVDPAGRAVPVRYAAASREGAQLARSEVGEEPEKLLTGLPPGPLQVLVFVAGREHQRTHDPRAGDLVVEVPAAGRVSVLFEPPLEPRRDGLLRLVGPSDAARVWTLSQPLRPGEAHARIELGSAEAGNYELRLTAGAPGEPDVELLRLPEVVVRAGEETLVRVDPRPLSWP